MSKTSKVDDYECVDTFSDDTEISTDVLDLSELAEKYAQNVPFRFQVVNGFMAENTKDPTIGVDEVYSLHLVRELKVVVVKHDGEEFEIPVNSTAKFGLIHETPVSVYDSVDAILSAKHFPKVVAVRSKYVHPDGKVSLKKNEVLLIKEVMKGKFGRGKSALKVFSISSYKEFLLPKDCGAQFCTDPEDTQLYLTDLLNNGIDFMPCSARIYPGEDSSLAELRSDVISIERQEIHKSVIISLFRDNPTAKQKEETNFIDVPTAIGIRVTVMKTDRSDEIYERIFKQSEALLTDYNPSKIQVCVDARTNDQYMTQAQLLAEIRKEKEVADSAPLQYQQLLAKQEHRCYQSPSQSASEAKPKSNILSLPFTSSHHEMRADNSVPLALPSSPAAACSGGKGELTGNLEVGPKMVASKKKKPPPPIPMKKNPVHEDIRSSNSHPVGDKGFHPVTGDVHCDPGPPAHRNSSRVRSDEAARSGGKGELTGNLEVGPKMVAPKKKKPPPPIPMKKNPVHESSNSHPVEQPGDKGSPFHPVTGDVHCDPGPPAHRNSSRVRSDDASQTGHSADKVCMETASKVTNEESEVALQSTYVKFSQLSQPPSSSTPNSKAELQLEEIQTTLSTIMKQVSEIQTRQSAFEKELTALKTPAHPKPSTTITTDMSPADVQMVLSAAGLSQYQESFSREAVDGDMFMMLDDEILCKELGVNSRLHRVRIMKMKGSDRET